jgi:hypothetical protein
MDGPLDHFTTRNEPKLNLISYSRQIQIVAMRKKIVLLYLHQLAAICNKLDQLAAICVKLDQLHLKFPYLNYVRFCGVIFNPLPTMSQRFLSVIF